MRLRLRGGVFLCALLAAAHAVHAVDVPLGGFIPFMGIGLTKEFDTFETDETGTFYIADRAPTYGGPALGPNASAFFDIALLDTGAATHILTAAAGGPSGFAIQAEGLRGINKQEIFGASGSLELLIDDPMGWYAAGLADRQSAGAALVMNTGAMRGQTSFAPLEAPAEWTLPNILGLPIAAHYGIAIRNDEPQIFQLGGRTVRTPNIDLIDRGGGVQLAQQLGITRRTELLLRPSASFLTGPLYVQNLSPSLDLHNNPLSPSVLDSGAMFVETDLSAGMRRIEDKEFLFDTGADLTVVSQLTASRLGFDVEFDEPDFLLEVEGAGGVTAGVPGFYVDELNIDTIGGTFTLQNVPVAVIDLPDPNDPTNVLDGILGMHLFTGRNVIIDPNPAPLQIGGGPRLYIGNEVFQTHIWTSTQASAAWADDSSWSGAGTPGIMWDAQAINVTGAPQSATIAGTPEVYRLTVAGSGAGTMGVEIPTGATLTTYGEALVKSGGDVRLRGGKLDAQFVLLDGGSLTGSGSVFVGTGPVTGAVRNLTGLIAPRSDATAIGALAISGDLVNAQGGTMEFDLAGPAGQHDTIAVDRFAFLGGTLKVNLLGYTPAVGAMFTLLDAAGRLFGTFDALNLPTGFTWQVAYANDMVVLKVTGLGSLAGDFDGNGQVNAQDLATWRTGYGTLYDGKDFVIWQRNLGAGVPAVGSAAVVPEPGSALLVAAAIVAGSAVRGKRRR